MRYFSDSILVLVLNSKLSVAPKYLRDHIIATLFATSHRQLRSSDWQALCVPRVRTAMTQIISFATFGPSFGMSSLPLFA